MLLKLFFFLIVIDKIFNSIVVAITPVSNLEVQNRFNDRIKLFNCFNDNFFINIFDFLIFYYDCWLLLFFFFFLCFYLFFTLFTVTLLLYLLWSYFTNFNLIISNFISHFFNLVDVIPHIINLLSHFFKIILKILLTNLLSHYFFFLILNLNDIFFHLILLFLWLFFLFFIPFSLSILFRDFRTLFSINIFD